MNEKINKNEISKMFLKEEEKKNQRPLNFNYFIPFVLMILVRVEV